MLYKFFALLAVVCLGGCSVVGIRTYEQADYSTLEKESRYEIRQYADFLGAETTVSEGDWDDASNVAFKRLAGYIFGKNKTKQKMAMTGPVFMSPEKESSQKIAMTAPVLAEKTEDGWKMSFVLPSDVTFENAPDPLDDKVIVKKQEGKKYAVARFSGFLSEEKFLRYSKQLQQWMEEQNLEQLSEPLLAGYDPPWTIPFLRRNEVLIEVR